MTIEWNKVTRLSQFIAIVLFVGVFALGFWLGTVYTSKNADTAMVVPQGLISDVSYQCANEKAIHALYYEEKVTLMLSDGRTFNLPHVISGSGARYANDDESVVFWEKGTTAFMTEKAGAVTYADCNEAPIPQ